MTARTSSCFLRIQISSIYDRWDKNKEAWSLTIFYRNMGSHQQKTWRPFGNQRMNRHYCCCQAPMAICMVIWGNEAEVHSILVSPILLLWQILWPKWLLRVKGLFYFTVLQRKVGTGSQGLIFHKTLTTTKEITFTWYTWVYYVQQGTWKTLLI